MIALLDANILIDVGKAGLIKKLASLADQVPWCITREVFDELATVPGRSLLSPHTRPSPIIGTSEALLCISLARGGPWAALGVGESASIAAASHDPRFEFVTWDIRASWRSLHELRGRTVVGHTWLQHLVDLGLLAAAEADRIARADATRHHPTWWSYGRAPMTLG